MNHDSLMAALAIAQKYNDIPEATIAYIGQINTASMTRIDRLGLDLAHAIIAETAQWAGERNHARPDAMAMISYLRSTGDYQFLRDRGTGEPISAIALNDLEDGAGMDRTGSVLLRWFDPDVPDRDSDFIVEEWLNDLAVETFSDVHRDIEMDDSDLIQWGIEPPKFIRCNWQDVHQILDRLNLWEHNDAPEIEQLGSLPPGHKPPLHFPVTLNAPVDLLSEVYLDRIMTVCEPEERHYEIDAITRI